ncbi:hypothetical protein QE250_05280 [Chromatiaceae bacterium AAb-1]|nr:hypothetical protein [Chromatiaceae bacterium AAb-1]
MGALYVILVLAVGYVYCTLNPAKKYKLSRIEGYSLYFYIGFWGTIWTLFAIVIFFLLDLFNLPSALLKKSGFHFKIFETASAFTLAEVKQLILCIGTLLITLGIALFRKSYFKVFKSRRRKLMLKAAKSNAMELLLFESINNYRPLAFTMDSDKVYVGFVSDFDPIDGKIDFITILPLLSGYRDEQKSLKFTTNYYEHYTNHLGDKAQSPDDPETWELMEKFQIMVPSTEIVTVSGFDIDAYKQFMASDFNSESYKENLPVEPSSYTVNQEQIQSN